MLLLFSVQYECETDSHCGRNFVCVNYECKGNCEVFSIFQCQSITGDSLYQHFNL